jgi:hypothetical protein
MMIGAEVCVTSSDPPFCETYFDDCSQGCQICGPGCCASLKDNKKGSCSTIKTMAWQGSTVKPDTLNSEHDKQSHLKEFLAMADRGVFDRKIIYTHPDSSIAKGLMSLPVSHWKSFTQKVVLKGGQDKPIKAEQGRPQTILDLETKTGHKLVIHLVDESAMKWQQRQPQSKLTTPSLED